MRGSLRLTARCDRRRPAVTLGALVGIAAAGPVSARQPEAGPRAPRLAMLATSTIRNVVLRHMQDVSRCHEQALVADPRLQGRVVLRFTIGPDGRVSAAEAVDPEPNMRSVGACIAAAIRLWRFDPPGGGRAVTVNYPFTLLAPETGAEPRTGGTTRSP